MKNKEENQKYVQGLVKKLQEGVADLTDVERRLGKNFLDSQRRAMEASREADHIEKQIRADQANLAQLRDKISVEMGKGAGIMEAIVAMRPEAASKDNGEKKPDLHPVPGEDKEGAEA